MEKVYLVTSDWCSGCDCGNEIEVFKQYEDAKKRFNELKENIKSFNLGYDNIENEEDYYCESIEGDFNYNHEIVFIQEKEVL